MTELEAVLKVIETLEKLGIAYMVVGSFSSNLYGIPRSTRDGDIVVALGSRSIREASDLLGAPFRLDPQISFETATTRHVLNVLGTKYAFQVEIYNLSDDPHDQERFRRRVAKDLAGRKVMAPTPEDVIITKAIWARGRNSQDAEDVRNVIAVQGDGLDWDYIYRWADQHGTRALLDDLRASIPPI